MTHVYNNQEIMNQFPYENDDILELIGSKNFKTVLCVSKITYSAFST